MAQIVGNKRAAAFFARARQLHPDCRICEFKVVCNGGCVFYRIADTGRPEGKDPMCNVYKSLFANVKRGLEAAIQ